MAPTRTTSVAEKNKNSSALGKRSREPLAESSANKGPKRRKPAPDSHPGETDENEESRDEPSFDYPPPVDDEELPEACGDEDTEAVEDDVDAEKTAEQEAQYTQWFRNCSRNDKFRHLSDVEREERKEKCQERLSYILKSLIQTARDTKRAEFYEEKAKQKTPMTQAWWAFFLNISHDKVLPLLMASLADVIQVFLGGPLTADEFLKLPSRWDECGVWGVYIDVLTKKVDKDIPGPETARYCGSGMAVTGVQSRLRIYRFVKAGTHKSDGTKHQNWLTENDDDMNLRVMAVFNQYKVAKPYVLLMELLLTILLQTLPTSVGGIFRRAMTVEMILRALPLDLPKATHSTLNGAAQCLQGLSYSRPKYDSDCEDCPRAVTPGSHAQWYSAEPGLPFHSRICQACYSYRRMMGGRKRGPEQEEKLIRNRALNEEIGEKPAPGSQCPGCLSVSPDIYWVIPGEELTDEPDRRRWECNTCYTRPTAELLANNQARLDATQLKRSRKDAIKQLGPKPADGTGCPNCGTPTVKRKWSAPQGDLLSEPGRFRWECHTCYALPTDQLHTRVSLAKRKAQKTNTSD